MFEYYGNIHVQAAQCSLVQYIYFGLQKIGSLCPKNRRKNRKLSAKNGFFIALKTININIKQQEGKSYRCNFGIGV